MSGFNGIGDLGWLGEGEQPPPMFNQSSNQSQSVSTQVSAQATGGSISNSANVGSRIGNQGGGALSEIPWAWVIGAVVLASAASYFLMGGGVKFQNPIQLNPPRRRGKRKAKRNPPRRRSRAARQDDDSEDDED